MDDLFSILIYLIIIISFLSSVFKKKKQQGPPQQQSRMPQDRIPGEAPTADTPSVRTETSDYDILKEIENMFKTEEERREDSKQKIGETSRNIEMKPPSEKISYEEYAASREASYDMDSPAPVREYRKKRPEPSEHTYASLKRESRKVDSKVEEQARKFKELLDKKASPEDKFRRELVRKIQNPETIREYILVAEILARPKALRR
jgi:hypothetical protein